MKAENQTPEPNPDRLSLETMMAFLEGRLSPEREAEVEEVLARSPEDVAALEGLEKQLSQRSTEDMAGLEMAFLDGLEGVDLEAEASSNPISRERENSTTNESRNRSQYRLLWGAGLAACLAVMVYFSFFYEQAKSTPKELFAEYFTPYEDIYTERDNIESALEMEQAMVDYNAGNYVAALPNFEAILAIRPGHTLAGLYAGICYLNAGEVKQAKGKLGRLARRETAVQPIAIWYMAMANLRIGHREEAREWLERLIGQSGTLGDQAKEVLDKLGDE